jgi:hypothetical protein
LYYLITAFFPEILIKKIQEYHRELLRIESDLNQDPNDWQQVHAQTQFQLRAISLRTEGIPLISVNLFN